MKLLIVEDDRVTRAMLVAFVKANGYEPVEAEDGAMGLSLMQEEDPPRLLLLDWMMPKMDGVDLCKAVRRLGLFPEPHIILLTAKDDIDDMVYGLESGANDFITKPYQEAELRARLGVGGRYIKNQWALVKEFEEAELDEMPDRQSVMDILQLEMIASRRDPSSLCVGIAELDGERSEVGLRAFAAGIRRALRPNDFLGGYGASSFLVIANVPAPNAKDMFARMLAEATAGAPDSGDASNGLSGRIGLASFKGENSPAELLARAEDALPDFQGVGSDRVGVG